MKSLFTSLVFVLICVISLRADAKTVRTITVEEARALARLILRHEGIRFSPKYCELHELHLLDKPDKPFVPDYYSFGARCDFPNTPVGTYLGLFVVSPRTGNTFDYNSCETYSFPELRRMQQKIKRRTHASDSEEAHYFRQTDCAR